MKARLVRPLCFVLTMLPQKSLASSSIWSVSFRPGCEFCVSECHQKGVKSSTEEKVCPFSFSLPVPLRGKQTEIRSSRSQRELKKFVRYILDWKI